MVVNLLGIISYFIPGQIGLPQQGPTAPSNGEERCFPQGEAESWQSLATEIVTNYCNPQISIETLPEGRIDEIATSMNQTHDTYMNRIRLGEVDWHADYPADGNLDRDAYTNNFLANLVFWFLPDSLASRIAYALWGEPQCPSEHIQVYVNPEQVCALARDGAVAVPVEQIPPEPTFEIVESLPDAGGPQPDAAPVDADQRVDGDAEQDIEQVRGDLRQQIRLANGLIGQLNATGDQRMRQLAGQLLTTRRAADSVVDGDDLLEIRQALRNLRSQRRSAQSAYRRALQSVRSGVR